MRTVELARYDCFMASGWRPPFIETDGAGGMPLLELAAAGAATMDGLASRPGTLGALSKTLVWDREWRCRPACASCVAAPLSRRWSCARSPATTR